MHAAATEAPAARDAASEAELQAFADALGAFMRATRRARGRFAAERPDGDLTLSQYQLLDALLDADGPLTVREIAIGAGVASPTATRALTALEHDGLVARERPKAGDQRCVLIRLTPEGRARLAAKREHVQQWRRAVFASLSPQERGQAARLLRHLAGAVEEL
ncbi:MAG TPA: MarR family transcriptional regulator [Solirubrobacteraceae bacterium]|nr:MarR family transcriptional regulator [Solirubrobacteraceae bacterium]